MTTTRILTFAVICCWAGGCTAAELVAAVQSNGLAIIDWAIIVMCAAGTIGLGWYYSRRQGSRQEYFVGSGRMNPFLVGVSLFATC